jgi:hypothetical protein
MKIAVTGIIHSKSTKFFNEYIKSIYNQSFKDFDLILFNQDINDERGLHLDKKLSLSEAKKFTIDYIKNNGYDILIFTDTDDFLETTYIEEIIRALEKYDIAFTDLCIYDPIKETKVYDYFQKCGVPDTIDINYIEDKNCIGWGNSGIKLKLHYNIEKFEERWGICDWWYFKTIMKKNSTTAKFIKKSLVNYRQHDNNVSRPNTKEFKLWNGVNNI